MPSPFPLYRPPMFPNVRPGFDKTHVLAQGQVDFSIVPSGGTAWVNLLTGLVHAATGSPTFSIDGQVGPALTFPTGASHSITIPGGAFTLSECTWICIFVPRTTVTGASHDLFDVGNVVKFTPGILSSGHYYTYLASNGTTQDSGITLALQQPYFVASSLSISLLTLNMLVYNLSTGQLATAQTSLSGTAPTTGTSYQIGNDSFGQFAAATIAAMAFTRRFASLSSLVQAAADPWSFWYPQDDDVMQFGAAAAAAFLAAWAQQNNYPVIGTGGY